MSHLQRVQSFESLLKKETKRVQFFESFSRQDQSFLWVKIFVKKKTFGRPDDRMIIPDKFQTHRINDLIHQDQTEKAKHWKKTNNSRKPHSKWTSLGFDAQQWLTQTRCWRSQWTSYYTKQDQLCPFKGCSTGVACHSFLVRVWALVLLWFKVACRNVFLRIVPWRQTTSPHNQLPTTILRLKVWGSPRLLVPTFRSRRLCRQIELLNTVYVNQQSRRSNKRKHH